MTDAEKEALLKLIERYCSQIIEHVDTVQIFVTKHNGEDGETLFADAGRGNFYARQGQVAEWLVIQEQFQRNHAIRRDNER